MCGCTVCSDGSVAMTGKHSRPTELIRQEALREAATPRSEALVAKQIDDEFDQKHAVTNFVKLCLVCDLLTSASDSKACIYPVV